MRPNVVANSPLASSTSSRTRKISSHCWGLSTSLQRWQTLQSDPLNPVTPPYSTSQVNLSAIKPIASVADSTFTGNVAQFTHPTLINGNRAFAYPTVSLPLQTSYAYVTPKMGMHMTSHSSSIPGAAGSN